MERTKWVDRKFTFDAPEGWIFNVIERLRGAPVRIDSMTRSLSNEKLSFKPAPDTWSIKEHIGHLFDLESLHDGRLDDFTAGREILRAADMTNAETNRARHNEQDIDSLINMFATRRAGFIQKLESLDDATQYRKSLHPRLQVMMRPIDVAIFTAEHDDHHLCWIRELM